MKHRSRLLGAALTLLTMGCSSSDAEGSGPSAPNEKDEVLNLFSWWVAPGEREALEGLERLYKNEYVGARVKQEDSPTAGNWQEVLGQRIDDSPWDVFQLSASDLDNFRADHPGAVADLTDVYEDAGLGDVVIPEIRDAVTRDGRPYGVVTGVHRNNAFIYNQRIFEREKLSPPKSLEELLVVCAKLKAAGVTPIASDMDTWVLRIFFDEVLAGTLGAEGFRDFIAGKADRSDPELQSALASAIETFDTLLTEYVDTERASAADYAWTTAADDLHADAAAMLFHGDWAKGYLMHLGFTQGVDFGVDGPPGAADLFVYGADMFGLATTAPHPELGRDFLAVVASPQGQIEFNRYKGATPMRSDIRDQIQDDALQLSLDNLRDAKVLIPGHPNATWEAGIEAFAKDRDRDALLQVYVETAP